MYSETNTSLSTRRNPTAQDRSRTVELRNVGGGFPHSEIVGSKPVRSSPTLIAAYHVLHRLSAPRHPPNALKTLDRSHDRCSPPRSHTVTVAKTTTNPERLKPACFVVRPAEARSGASRLAARVRRRATPSQAEQTNASRCQTTRGMTDKAQRARQRPRESRGSLERSAIQSGAWWSQTGSNRRPHACKARALPAELWPLPARSEDRPEVRRRLIGGPGRT